MTDSVGLMDPVVPPGLDPRRQALFEDRFLGRSPGINTSSQVTGSDNGSDPSAVSTTTDSQTSNSNSLINVSDGSGEKMQTTETESNQQRIATERNTPTSRRKRRNPDAASGDSAATSNKTRPDARKIIDYFKSHSSPTKPPTSRNIEHESEFSNDEYSSDHSHSQFADTSIRLNSEISALKDQLTTERIIVDRQEKSVKRCIHFIKNLLIEKRQFVSASSTASRTGLSDVWIDGYAIIDLKKRLSEISSERDDIDRQRRQLSRNKNVAIKQESEQQRTNKMQQQDQTGVTGVLNKDSSGFIRPNTPSSQSLVDEIFEYCQTEDILKLRLQTLKKEENELNKELEKLKQEQNLHVRECKRILNEDNSRFQNHEVLDDRYLLLSLLGKGGFSEVHKAFDLSEQMYVAVKVHRLNVDWTVEKRANFIKHAKRELEIHQKLDHIYIAHHYRFFSLDSNSFCTVMEYCSGNDLDFYLKQNSIIPEKEARCVLIQTLSALKYLNEINPPVIHYDLKPANVLLVTGEVTGTIKLTDFGLSKVMEEERMTDEGMDLTSQGAGTYWYLPPECFRPSSKITSKVDVWSLGVLFFQCMYGRKPWGHNQSQAAIIEQQIILNKAHHIDFPTRPPVSIEAKNFIRRCCTYDKEVRPSVLQLCQDDYIRPFGLRAKKFSEPASPATFSSPGSVSSNNSTSRGGGTTGDTVASNTVSDNN